MSVALLLTLLTGLSALLPAAPEVAVNVSIQPEPAEVGLLMSVTVTVAGPESVDCDLIAVPEVQGARLVHTSGPNPRRMLSITNGRRRESIETSWEFELVPAEEGLLTVGPFVFNCRGDELSTRSQSLHVQPSRLPEELVTMSVTPSATDLWVGQVVTFDVAFSVAEDAYDSGLQRGMEIVLPWLSETPDLHALDPPMPNCRVAMATIQPGGEEVPTCLERGMRGGVSHFVHRQSLPMVASRPGTLTLPDSRFSFRLVTDRRQAARNDPFGLLGSLGRVPSRVVVASAVAPGPTLTIREPPEAGRPPSFTNAVGSYQLNASVEPRELAVGQSCRLRLDLIPEGGQQGYLALIEWPSFDLLADDFKVFGKQQDSKGGTRTLELELAPVSADVTSIPRLEFSVFDPASERYETLSVGPFALDVRAGSGGNERLTVLSTPEEILNDLETIREELPAPAAPLPEPWVWIAGAAAVLGLAELLGARRRWRAAHPATLARQGARRVLQDELAAAKDVSAVASAFARYLAARLGGPPAGLTQEEAAERLPAGPLRDELVDTLTRWEAAYLGGAALELSAVRDEARSLADRLEREA